jgi:hypothetical protein
MSKITYLKLENVGSLLDPATLTVYPELTNGDPELSNGSLLSECSEEFKDQVNYNQLIDLHEDLFEVYEILPEKVTTIIETYDENAGNLWDECKRIITELEQIGWTAEYDMAGDLIDLRMNKQSTK